MGRDEAISTAKTDPGRALSLARKVPDPWGRAQALAWVGRLGAPENVEAVALEAANAASECSSTYQQLAALAWPVRMLIDRGLAQRASSLLEEAIEKLQYVEPSTSRPDAAQR